MHVPREQQSKALPYMPKPDQDRLRQRIHGHKLMQQRDAKTKEWRMAVAHEDGTIKEVSALYGVPEMTVRRWRAEFPKPANGNGHKPTAELSRRTYDFIQRTIRGADILGDREKPYGQH